jgi:GT2 family glycosyltransferase
MLDNGLNREDELLRENDMLAAENERLLRELRDAGDKYTAIRNSLSWKVTAPLRKALDLIAKPKLTTGPQLLNNENYRCWIAQYDTFTAVDRSAIRAAMANLPNRPLLTLLVVIHDDPAAAILQTIQSIRRQLYRAWEICLVDDASTAPHVARALASCGDDPRVRVARTDGDAKQEALSMAKGDYVAFLDPGDTLAENALFEIATEINAHPETAVIYSDEDSLDSYGHRINPRFKTDWNPDLLSEQDYLGKLTFRRASREPGATRHLPSILCHTANNTPAPVTHRHRELPDPAPKVSILIPTRDRAELLERCIEGLLNRTNYPAIEIIVLDNDSREEKTRQLFAKYPVRIISHPGEFNWAAMNNAGARSATGGILLFLNNDTDVMEPDWLRELAVHAARPEVGAVGAKLLFADNTVQHAGIWLGPEGRVRHLLRLSTRQDEGYLGQLSIARNLSAVTGACMAVRRELFLEFGGFDESYPVSYNDLDFCLRLRQKGYRIVWTPHAELLHLESASRGSSEWRWRKEEADHKRFCAQWQQELEHDPFFNPNLDLIGEERLALAFPPRVKKLWKR